MSTIMQEIIYYIGDMCQQNISTATMNLVDRSISASNLGMFISFDVGGRLNFGHKAKNIRIS